MIRPIRASPPATPDIPRPVRSGASPPRPTAGTRRCRRQSPPTPVDGSVMPRTLHPPSSQGLPRNSPPRPIRRPSTTGNAARRPGVRYNGPPRFQYCIRTEIRHRRPGRGWRSSKLRASLHTLHGSSSMPPRSRISPEDSGKVNSPTVSASAAGSRCRPGSVDGGIVTCGQNVVRISAKTPKKRARAPGYPEVAPTTGIGMLALHGGRHVSSTSHVPRNARCTRRRYSPSPRGDGQVSYEAEKMQQESPALQGRGNRTSRVLPLCRRVARAA